MVTTTDKGQLSGPFGRQDPSLPQVFGRYLLIQRLSRGGMGEIFLAKHGLAGFEKLAVIKKVLPHLAADASFISRFVDEAQVAIKLAHVNIAQVFEVGRVGDEYFLALEYVEGRDLRRTLALLGHRKQRLPVDLALFIGRELANGLAYAHRRTSQDGASLNLVHCDVSPPNVLVSFEGETKVIDFGIAKSALRGTATDPKMGFGKFGYMAPEQLIRGGVVDHRTDIYAAGVVLYELLTGQRLYEAGPEPDYRALAKKVARGEHPMPSEIDPLLAPYDDLVATALRPKAEDRYQTAAEFRDAIQQALVAVNPTISTDQLGAYMRDLFAEEMTAQRELHDRVANAHLSDFQEAFHTQTISTVSFALAQLPLPPPAAAEIAATPRPRRVSQQQLAQRTRNSGQHSSLRTPLPPDSPALDTVAPPTAALSSEDLGLGELADGTGTSPRAHAPQRDRTKLYAIGAAVVVTVAVIVGAFAMRGGKDEPAAKRDTRVATTEPAKQSPPITVEPIDPPTPPHQPVVDPKAGSGSAAPPEIQIKPDKIQREPKRNPRTQPKERPQPPDPPKSEITKDMVTSKFQQAQRMYSDYKSKNGGRLEAEYADLMTYLQYDKPQPDRMKKIEAFISKMRE
ncbi:MAG TPA: protein kinase [Kofleriaceae bacterium]|nr:protein kinase [Kofleriaceae bacterium]